jgi:hypothetical protein
MLRFLESSRDFPRHVSLWLLERRPESRSRSPSLSLPWKLCGSHEPTGKFRASMSSQFVRGVSNADAERRAAPFRPMTQPAPRTG